MALAFAANAIASVQSQQFTDRRTPHKLRGFLMSLGNCSNFVLEAISVNGAQHDGTGIALRRSFIYTNENGFQNNIELVKIMKKAV